MRVAVAAGATLLGALLTAGLPRTGAGGTPAIEKPLAEEAPDVERLHGDAKNIEQAVLDATRAFMREDSAAARKALDRLANESRELAPEDDARYGSAVLNYNRALRVTLDRARESAGKGELEPAFDQFVWVQRTCRICHGLARERGLLAAPVATDAPPR